MYDVSRQITDRTDVDDSAVLRAFKEGDATKAVILSVNPEKGRISFGLKPSYLGDNHRGDADFSESVALDNGDDPYDNDGASSADDVPGFGSRSTHSPISSVSFLHDSLEAKI